MKLKYTLPSNSEEITLQQYIKYEQIITDENFDDTFKIYRTVELFTGINYDHIKHLKQSELDNILNHLKPLLNPSVQLHKTFKYNGIKYGLIPNFSRDLKTGEFIDLDIYTENKKWLEVMSILYRPITFERKGQYKIEPYMSSHTDFKDLPFTYFIGVAAFFLTLLNQLAQLTQRYTDQEIQKLMILV